MVESGVFEMQVDTSIFEIQSSFSSIGGCLKINLFIILVQLLSLFVTEQQHDQTIAQSTRDTSTARCTPMTICRPVLEPKTGSTKRITLLLVRRLHLHSVSGWTNSCRVSSSPVDLG